jgi:OOP family OmpA-OmpF porin
MTHFRVAALLLAVVSFPPLVAAQDWTDQELRERFESQLDTFRDLGPERGLVLTNRPAASAADGAAVAAAEASGMAAAPAAEVATPTLGLQGSGAGGTQAAHVTLPEDEQVYVRVTFAFDSAALGEDQKPALRQLCRAMEATGAHVFRIIGHTDASGGARYNQQLSVLRAEEVKRFFVEDCGVAPERLEAIGVGKDHPFNAGDPYAAENRRVEFQAMS